ncbi:Heparinase II/III family protein [Candidatus Accumulibacter phosphatis]|jgi:hypothetical protein|uniref:Heparinase II/III family protein n=2 Tax=Betaproteobacteria incertae sedis TaxID=119066 RepID=C7RNQ9_ACCRE
MFRNVSWRFLRLRAMDAPELVYRVRQSVRARLEQWGIGRASPGEPTGLCGRAWLGEVPRGFELEAYRSAADRILSGQFGVFAMRDATLGFPPAWNQDPKTRTVVPLVFGKTLNYRDERVVGDIKYLWEPNRHLELVTLAQAWRLTGDARFSEGCRALLDSWFAQCPYPLGPNWTSSLEHAVRLMNWSFAWHLLGGDESRLFVGVEGAAFRTRWLRSVFQHCHFIAGHLSRHSSANNHLLGEYMGLLVGTVTWPMWPESAEWKSIAAPGFETEALKQNAPDGVNREQAVYYQHEVIDMMLLCGLICRANGIEFSASYWERLERLMEFLAAVMDCAGHVPMIGDADDALMVRLSQGPGRSRYRSLLATGAVLFSRGDFAAKARRFDDKSRWLLGDSAAEVFDALPLPETEKPRTAFSEGGYYLMGARLGAADEVRALIDCGPLGYLSIAAHGHADALSFVLSAGGRELLIDPGTYAYHTQKKCRDYFRGTFAHNTLRVDGTDQSVIGGNFLWLGKANAHCELAELDGERQIFRGRHDGYRRLSDPLTHQREISFDAVGNRFEVIDVLRCAGRHEVELCWHFAEHCVVTCAEGVVTADSGPVRLTMDMEECALSPSFLRGEEDPHAGWISRSFDVKTPTTMLVWRGTIGGPVRLVTRLALSFDLDADRIGTSVR